MLLLQVSLLFDSSGGHISIKHYSRGISNGEVGVLRQGGEGVGDQQVAEWTIIQDGGWKTAI